MSKLVILFLLAIPATCFAQLDTTKAIVKSRSISKAFIIPATLCISGVVIKQTDFNRSFQEKIQGSRLRSNTQLDDYIQYTPIAALFSADYAYSKTKNEIFQQSKNLAFSYLLTSIIVQTIKRTTNITRPDGTEHSFPSGHTATSFTGATALYLEYNKTNKFIAFSGYGISTATGFLRITNNRHWLSDVIMGAGIGIASAQIVWLINPLKNWQPFRSKDIAIYPYVNGLSGNAGFSIVF